MDDRLSALSDDLLRRILHFVPLKEAASTSVLSRRWGSLWRSSGAVNLAVRVHGSKERGNAAFFSRRDAFVRAAQAALDAAEAPVTRLTLRVDTGKSHANIGHFLRRSRESDAVGAVLSHRAARRVEHLRVALADADHDACGFSDREVERDMGIYDLVSLPASATLRVLDLTRCDLALWSRGAAAAAAFPRLATLRLRLCSVKAKDLQALLDAAPELATVHLDSVLFTWHRNSTPYQYQRVDEFHGNTTAAELPVVGLSFRAVTVLVLALCGQNQKDRHGAGSWALEIDAPKLRSLEYKGILRRFLLKSPAPDMERLDLHILHDRGIHNVYYENKGTTTKRALFWQFLHNFTNVRALKLKVDYDLKDIAVVGTARRVKLLCAFPGAERLELEGVHRPTSKTAAVAIANLLHCCPVLRDFRLKLSTILPYAQRSSSYGRSFLKRKNWLDYSESIDRFTSRSKKARIAMEDSSGADRLDDVADIPGLSGRSFACLQSSLRRVGLQFRLGEDSSSSCLGVRLVKFFADNAMVLEEMCVDSGNRRLYEHLNLSNSTKSCFEHKNMAEGSWEFSKIPSVPLNSTTDFGRSTTGFKVLPLQRRTRI